MTMLPPIPHNAALIAVDPATHRVGFAVLTLPECEAVVIRTLSDRTGGDERARLADLATQLREAIVAAGAEYTLLCGGIEEPGDTFLEDHHRTKLLMGRALDRLDVVMCELLPVVFLVTPGESSAALGLSKGASKADRCSAVALRCGATFTWRQKQKRGAGRWRGLEIDDNGLDAVAAGEAAYARWQEFRRLSAVAQQAAEEQGRTRVAGKKRTRKKAA